MAGDIDYIDGVPSLTVTQFAQVVNELLSATFDTGVWIEGEIESLKRPNPHVYPVLIDDSTGEKAQVNLSIFAGALNGIQKKLRAHGIELKDGLRLRVFGYPDYYAPHGKLGIKVRDVDTAFTVGDIAAKREELLRKLLESGVDRLNKRRTVPLVPLRLGVVSSTQAAGWADARERLEKSGIGFTVSFVDVRVQGDEAPSQIVAALKTLSRRDDIDVVLLMRGGGAKGDLAAFDDEGVARAVADCRHPVFTGIGHQIDESIADLMAHTRFITPTACAEGVISIVNDFTMGLREAQRELRLCTESSLIRARGRLVMALERLKTRPRNAFLRQSQVLAMHASALRLLDPAVTMARGWSIVRDSDGSIITSTQHVSTGDIITVSLADGSLTGKVEGTTQ